nr:hypothetical protein [uncultured Lichenicoccus sp.]
MTDRYIKSVLTIIAACLVVLVGQHAIIPAYAQTAQEVTIKDINPYAFMYQQNPLHVVCDNCVK